MTYFFKKPFASAGDITQIPINSQGDGNVSYEKGWTEGYELDTKIDFEDARSLSRTNFNGLFFNITSVLQQFQKMGANPYITAAENGGEVFAYPEGGLCVYTDTTTNKLGVYRSLTNENESIPSENGVTNKNWQRIFSADVDTIKSDRVYSTLLYYNTAPRVDVNTEGYTFTIFEDTKILFSDGINEDKSLKNNIVHFINSVSKTIDQDGRYIFFATSTEDLLILQTTQYSFFNKEDEVIEELGSSSTEDNYYFNSQENKWKVRKAEATTFEDLDFSLCLIGSVDINNGDVQDGEFGILPPFRMLTEFEVDKRLENKQNLLTPGRHLSIENITKHQDLLKVDLIANTTHFSVNSCNLDSGGKIDLLYIDTKLVPIVEYRQIDVYYQVSRLETRNRIDAFGSNGRVSWGAHADNPTHAFGLNSSYTANFVVASTRGVLAGRRIIGRPVTNSDNTYLRYDFNAPPHIVAAATLTFSYNFPGGNCRYGYDHRQRNLSVDILFTDGTSYRCYQSATYTNNGSGWINRSIPIPVQYRGKYVAGICFNIWLYVYCDYSHIPHQVHITNVQLAVEETVWETRVRQETIENWRSEWRGKSNKLYFKTGSNYLDLLEWQDGEGNRNAIPMLDLANAKITSNISNFNEAWGSKNIIVKFSDWWKSFRTEYEFLTTPAETNNAKLFFRYNDTDAEGVLNNFSIVLTYWGGATYTLYNKKTLLKTQDVLLDLPNGKYLQKITIYADEMDNLGGSSLGMINLYNNVKAGLAFKQYPAIYASSADGTKYFMQNNVPTLIIDRSGYVMLSESGAYILPGTNVIRRQKHMPTIYDEPKLRDGDVWLDISSEPLRAYQYYNGTWLIFNDVPIGYVTAEYLDPLARAEKTSNTISSVSVNPHTFRTKTTKDGVYEFIFSNSNWYLNGVAVDLSQYGVTYTGQQSANDIIKVTFSMGTPTVTKVEQYPINQNGYDVNVYTQITNQLTGKDGRDGQDGRDGKDGKNGARGERGYPGIGVPEGGGVGQLLVKTTNENYGTAWTSVVPTGGIKGQFLAKRTNNNFDTVWSTVASTALFNGGRAGQALVKKSDNDMDFDWTSALPAGGSVGQALVKSSNADYETNWETLKSVPAGGKTNQALVKKSNNNYDYDWGDVAGGSDTDFIELKINLFFEGQTTGYQSLTTEDFKSITAVDNTVLNGADVITTYWNEVKRCIYNSNTSTISYRLKPFNQVVRGFYLKSLKEGEVTFSYSTDGGETWRPIEESTAYSVMATKLIIKIDQASGSRLSGIGILFR